MIILFYITDSLGRKHRCSAVCGPSTTAAGAINQLRSKLSIPTEVEVEVHLANDVPIRHLTAPLTSLRKQRSGSAQVLRMQLWASLTGSETAVQEIDYSAADVVDATNDEAEDEEAEEEVPPATTAHVDRRGTDSSAAGHASNNNGGSTPRIMFAVPASRAHLKPVPVQAKSPHAGAAGAASGSATTASAPAAKHARPTPPPQPVAAGSNAPYGTGVTPTLANSAVAAVPSTAAAKPHSAAVTTTPPPQPSESGSTSRLVIKRRESRNADGLSAEPPMSARGPVRRPLADTQHVELQMPMSARVGSGGSRSSGAAGAGIQHYQDPRGGTGGAYRTGYARRDAAMGHIMMREYPKVVLREPKNIVIAVSNDERLAARSYSRAFTATSDVDGVDDATYARFLSVGLTHGQELRSHTASGATCLALYGELSTLRHSCCPNAAVQYDLFTAPYAGTCRCAVSEGIQQGQEITYLFKHADSLAFLLLSPDRRRNILQRKYFMDCDCPRCTETVGDDDEAAKPIVKAKSAKTGTAKAATKKLCVRTKAQREAEASLTGAFFTDSDVDRDPYKQKQLMEAMRKDFDALQIMDDTGVEITLSLVGNVPPVQRTKQCNRLLGFLRKYGSAEAVLRLHEHHWRLNLARAAYVQETVRLCAVKGATPEARQRDLYSKTLFQPTKTVYDICLKQLGVEALYIPSGHPHSLTTYESFLYLVAILPPAVAQSVMRTAQSTSSIRWKQLEETKEAWGVLKRATLPPQIQQLVQRKETGGAPEPQSTPVTARGMPSQDLSRTANATVKLPPKTPRMEHTTAVEVKMPESKPPAPAAKPERHSVEKRKKAAPAAAAAAAEPAEKTKASEPHAAKSKGTASATHPSKKKKK